MSPRGMSKGMESSGRSLAKESEAKQELVRSLLGVGDLNEALAVAKKMEIPEGVVAKLGHQMTIENMSHGSMMKALKMKRFFGIPNESISADQDAHDAMHKGVEVVFKYQREEELDYITYNLGEFPVDREVAQVLDIKAEVLVPYYLERQDAYGLRSLVSILDNAGREALLADTSKLEQSLDTHVKEQNWRSANQMIEAFDILGKTVDPALKDTVGTHLTEHKEMPDRVLKEENVLTDLVRFYSNSFLDQAIKQKEHEAAAERPTGKELSMRDRVSLEDRKAEIAAEVERMHSWVREYVIGAIASEFSEQDLDFSIAPDLGTPYQEVRFSGPSADVFMRHADGEQIRLFTAAAEHRFNDPNWEPPEWSNAETQYGGKEWAKIARVAHESWQEQLPVGDKSILLDRAFQLQHNNGSVFDKEKERVVFDEDAIRLALDAQAEAKTFEAFEQAIRAIPDVDKRAGGQEALAALDRTKEKLRSVETIRAGIRGA